MKYEITNVLHERYLMVCLRNMAERENIKENGAFFKIASAG